ncbi:MULTISPECIES: GNAT family N-acetyltransferase [Kocuria]|uniref:GNAT family N-acetyltransferase n=1 Tax=Kocuria subflava TaxID=1736139 RepID=A0A846TRZ5_9MICC|nr:MULTISPECIES: GNAT family N-acetyltransferase [Kocuria]NKE09730.1 GNAT family N-acetyltransferase [Kocuria subflava]
MTDLPQQPPTLTDGVVTLTQMSESDVEQLVVNCQDPAAVRWTTVPDPYDADAARWYLLEHAPEAWRAGTAFNWAVHDTDGHLLGTVELGRIRGTSADIGLNFGPHARGTGAALAACRLLMDYAFTTLGFTHLHWIAFDGNWASVKLSWKLGFGQPVFIPGYLEQRGEIRDCWLATIRATDSRELAYEWRVPASS